MIIELLSISGTMLERGVICKGPDVNLIASVDPLPVA